MAANGETHLKWGGKGQSDQVLPEQRRQPFWLKNLFTFVFFCTSKLVLSVVVFLVQVQNICQGLFHKTCKPYNSSISLNWCSFDKQSFHNLIFPLVLNFIYYLVLFLCVRALQIFDIYLSALTSYKISYRTFISERPCAPVIFPISKSVMFPISTSKIFPISTSVIFPINIWNDFFSTSSPSGQSHWWDQPTAKLENNGTLSIWLASRLVEIFSVKSLSFNRMQNGGFVTLRCQLVITCYCLI